MTKDVAPWTVVAGNPAKVVKRRVLAERYKVQRVEVEGTGCSAPLGAGGLLK